MNWKTKVGVVIGVVVFVAGLLYIIKLQNDIIQRQNSIEQSVIDQKELINGITRSQSSLMSKKDLDRWAKDNSIELEPIKKDLQSLGAEIKGIQTLRSYTPGFVGTSLPSTTVVPNPDPAPIDVDNPDPFGYYSNRQNFLLTEPTLGSDVPFGEVSFSAWREDPWDLTVSKRTYAVDTVIGVDDSGRHIPYSKMYIVVDDKKHELKISEATYKEVLPTAKFHFYPKLFAGIDAGSYFTKPRGAVLPNLQLALVSYGKIKTNPEWVFIGVGAGYEVVDNNFSFVLSPASYNIAQHIPFIDNTYLRPTVGVTTNGDFSTMIGLGFGL